MHKIARRLVEHGVRAVEVTLAAASDEVEKWRKVAAHLAQIEGRVLTEGEANLARARYVRQVLANEARLPG